jgi:hypothetical protein
MLTGSDLADMPYDVLVDAEEVAFGMYSVIDRGLY